LRGIGVKTVAALVKELFLSTNKKIKAVCSSKESRENSVHRGDEAHADDDHDNEESDNETVVTELHPLGRLIQRLLAVTWDAPTMTLADRLRYEKDFLAAVLAYRHAIVYDPMQGKCCHLLPLDRPDVELVDHLPYRELLLLNDPTAARQRQSIVGTILPRDVATYIAEGWICPKRMTLRPTIANGTAVAAAAVAAAGDTNAALAATTASTPPSVVAALQAFKDSSTNGDTCADGPRHRHRRQQQHDGEDDNEGATTRMLVDDERRGLDWARAGVAAAMTTTMAPELNQNEEDTSSDELNQPETQQMEEDNDRRQSDDEDDDLAMETQER
jgi:hypothetical protein